MLTASLISTTQKGKTKTCVCMYGFFLFVCLFVFFGGCIFSPQKTPIFLTLSCCSLIAKEFMFSYMWEKRDVQ